MTNPNWNDDELENYRRLVKTGNGKDPEGIDGLAYTAVCEMYSRRVEREKNEKFCKVVTDAMLEVFNGMRFIEEKLGVSLREMSDEYFKEKMERARNETNAICKVLYAMRREYVDVTAAHGPMGDHVGTCRTIKVEALEDFIGRICEAIGIDWKDVVSYAEDPDGKDF